MQAPGWEEIHQQCLRLWRGSCPPCLWVHVHAEGYTTQPSLGVAGATSLMLVFVRSDAGRSQTMEVSIPPPLWENRVIRGARAPGTVSCCSVTQPAREVVAVRRAALGREGVPAGDGPAQVSTVLHSSWDTIWTGIGWGHTEGPPESALNHPIQWQGTETPEDLGGTRAWVDRGLQATHWRKGVAQASLGH